MKVQNQIAEQTARLEHLQSNFLWKNRFFAGHFPKPAPKPDFSPDVNLDFEPDVNPALELEFSSFKDLSVS